MGGEILKMTEKKSSLLSGRSEEVSDSVGEDEESDGVGDDGGEGLEDWQ